MQPGTRAAWTSAFWWVVVALRSSLALRFARAPWTKEHRGHLLQFLNLALALALTAAALLAIVAIQFSPDDHRAIWLATGGAITAVLVLALVPQRRVRLSCNVRHADLRRNDVVHAPRLRDGSGSGAPVKSRFPTA